MVSLTPHPIRVKPKKLLQIFEHKFGDSGHHISKTKAWSTLLENGQICLINHAFKYKHGQTGNKPISVWFNAYMRAAESGSKCCILQLKIELYSLKHFSFIHSENLKKTNDVLYLFFNESFWQTDCVERAAKSVVSFPRFYWGKINL